LQLARADLVALELFLLLPLPLIFPVHFLHIFYHPHYVVRHRVLLLLHQGRRIGLTLLVRLVLRLQLLYGPHDEIRDRTLLLGWLGLLFAHPPVCLLHLIDPLLQDLVVLFGSLLLLQVVFRPLRLGINVRDLDFVDFGAVFGLLDIIAVLQLPFFSRGEAVASQGILLFHHIIWLVLKSKRGRLVFPRLDKSTCLEW